MTLVDLLKKAFEWGPVLFGIGFIAPLIAQSMDALSLSAPVGLTNLQLGLALGLIGGTVAKLTGRWI